MPKDQGGGVETNLPVDQTPHGEDPWSREDFEEEEDDQEEAAEQVEAKSEDFGEDKEWTAE
jgi:hypothetical protein